MATRHSRSFLSATALSNGYTNANFPVANGLLYTRPNRPWKATSFSTSVPYVINFGSAQAVDTFLADNITSDLIVIEGDNATTFDSNAGSPQYTSGNLTVMKNGDDGRYRRFLRPSGFTRQYARIRPASGANVVNDTVWAVGSFTAFSATTAWSTPGGLPFIRTPLQASITNADGVSGGRDPVLTGNRYSLLTVNQPVMPIAMEDTILELLGYGMHAPFLFIRDDTDATLTEQAYIVRRVSTPGIEKLSPAHFSLSGLLLEGVV